MKADFSIAAGLVDNIDRFTDPFFRRFQLRPAPALLKLTEDISRQYQFPTFYGNVTCSVALFLCDYARAKALMPNPSMVPVRMPGGRAVVLFSCYEYRNVLNIGPYNEIAMTIPVMVGAGFHPLLLPLIMNFANRGFYVFSMPVTSLENQIRGRKFWGLPKVVEQIDFEQVEGEHKTIARDEMGSVYFELTVPTMGKRKHFDESGFIYSVLDGQLLKSETNFQGDFNVTSNFSTLWKKSGPAAKPLLKLGDSPGAEVLRQLQIEPLPFQTRYAKSMNSCFDLPAEPSGKN